MQTKKLLDQLDRLLDLQREHYDSQLFHEALKSVWDVVGAANRYVDEMAPWALRKTDPERMKVVLWVLAETLRQIAILIQPVMPEAAANMLDQLRIEDGKRTFNDLGPNNRMAGGQGLDRPQPIFPRYVEEDAE